MVVVPDVFLLVVAGLGTLGSSSFAVLPVSGSATGMGLGEMGLGEMGLGEMGLGEMGSGEMGLGEI